MLVVLILVILGFSVFLIIVFNSKNEIHSISDFFLGGRNIGSELTGDVFWGSSFSFANGLVYFVALGYYLGFNAFLLQIPWVISILIIAHKLPRILEVTEKHTMHGFIGVMIGPKARFIASLLTIFAFLGAFSYEINITVEIIFNTLKIPYNVNYISVVIAIFAAAYCSLGGFKGTARTDRIQNYLGLTAVLIIIMIVSFHGESIIPKEQLALNTLWNNIWDFSDWEFLTVAGILTWAISLNFVDMSNWQTISANTLLNQKSKNSRHYKMGLRKLKRAIQYSSIKIFFLPAFLGSFLGSIWRGIEGSQESDLISQPVSLLSEQSLTILSLLLGFVILGLAASALSTADSYLMGSIQTASWDIYHRKRLFRGENTIEDAGVKMMELSEQQKIIQQSRLGLFLLAIAGILIFNLIKNLLGKNYLIPLQFIIYSLMACLFFVVLYGLFSKSYLNISKFDKIFLKLSMYTGLISGICVMIYTFYNVYLSNQSDAEGDFDAFALTPIIVFVGSFIPFLVLIVTKKKQKK